MISIVMLSKNNQGFIYDTLNALKSFDEVVLIDTGSNDKTLEIAKKFPNVAIYQKKLTSFGKLRNIGASLAKNNWILAIDTDEIIQPNLINEINKLKLSKDCIYEIPFKNFYNGKWIKGCGWHPEAHIRLYNKTTSLFSDDYVHENVLKKNQKIVKLNNYIYHTSYRSLYDFIEKMQNYSELFAIQNVGIKKSSFSKALIHATFSFFKSYLLKRGFLIGKEGFIISFYNASTAFFKYLKLSEYNKQRK
jgi:glycosyltransferase involved in cell wall biosynthesis